MSDLNTPFPLWSQPPGRWVTRGADDSAQMIGMGLTAQTTVDSDERRWLDADGRTRWHYWAGSDDPATHWSEALERLDPGMRDVTDSEGAHPWHWLAWRGMGETMLLWKSKFGQPAAGRWQQDTLLHCAAWSGHRGTIDVAIGETDNDTTAGEDGSCADQTRSDQAGLAQGCLDQDGYQQINPRDKRGRTPVLIAIYRCQKDDIMSMIKRGADPDITDERGRSALHHAALLGDYELLGGLEDAGGDADLRDQDGLRPADILERHQNEAATVALRAHWVKLWKQRLEII